jgi:hypothetical protein
VSEHPVLQSIHAPLLRDFVRYWLDCRQPGTMVTRRADFDIFHIPALVQHLFLYDFDAQARHFVLRVAGEEIRRILPHSLPGTPLERIIPPAVLAQVQERYCRVCEEPAMLHSMGRVFLNLGGTGVGERVVLPLADERGAVYQLLGATIYQLGSSLDDGSTFAHEEVTLTYFPLTAD